MCSGGQPQSLLCTCMACQPPLSPRTLQGRCLHRKKRHTACRRRVDPSLRSTAGKRQKWTVRHLFIPTVVFRFRSPACATGETLNHSVPLPVRRWWQHVAGFHGGLRQVLLVLGYGGANASVLPVEEARAAVLQVLRIVQGGFWR